MDFGKLNTRNYFIAVGVFLIALFTLLEPAGSSERGGFLLLLQWTLQISLPLVVLISVHINLSRWSRINRLNPWLKLVLSGVLGSLLVSPIALGIDFLFGVDDWQAVNSQQDLLLLWLDEILGVTPTVTLVWLGINAPRVLELDFSQPTPERLPKDDKDAVDSGGLLSLLPSEIGNDIIYLMAELHYMRVVTTQGQTLLLYNLRDAIRELPASMGLQVHRSYWVAYQHISKLNQRNGKAELVLSDGSHVPVSRRRLNAVKDQLDNQTQYALAPAK